MKTIEVIPVHELMPDQTRQMYDAQVAAWGDAVRDELEPGVSDLVGSYDHFDATLRNPGFLVEEGRNKPNQRYGGLLQTESGPRDGLYAAIATMDRHIIGYGTTRLNVSWGSAEQPHDDSSLSARKERVTKTLTIVKKYLELSGLYVDPSFQGEGIGTDLLDAMLRSTAPVRLLNPVRSVAAYLLPDVYKRPTPVLETTKKLGLIATGTSPRKLFGPDSKPVRQVRVEASYRQVNKGGALNAQAVRRRLKR